MSPIIAEQIDLQPLNTLALPARARYFSAVTHVAELAETVAWAQRRALPLLVLGGGSNVVLAGDWPGLALRIALPGRSVDAEGRVEVAAGENWHELVQWTLAQGWYGLENLTLIPGSAGAAPIQNIGAYGVELADRLEAVRGWSIDDGRELELPAAECRLAYRDSIFKQALRGRFIVTGIRLRLSRRFEPVLSYPALREALGDAEPTAELVERTVRQIRQSRLPDPAVLPNAGSFFKNPVLSAKRFAELAAAYPALPRFPAPDGVKVPAAWLVEQSGWKGRRLGAMGVHDRQALVLIHYRDGDGRDSDGHGGAELLALAAAIQADVVARFGVALDLEPAVYPPAG